MRLLSFTAAEKVIPSQSKPKFKQLVNSTEKYSLTLAYAMINPPGITIELRILDIAKGGFRY
jgi:hypothetical protein